MTKMNINKKNIAVNLLVASFVIFSLDVFMFFKLLSLKDGLFFMPLSSISSREGTEEKLYGTYESEVNRKTFTELLKANGFIDDKDYSLKKALLVQNWLGNEIKDYGEKKSGAIYGYELLRESYKGHKIVCGAMSNIYREALATLGFKARSVQLYVGNFSSDTHVLVEAMVDGKWVVLDPTFNITYEVKGIASGVSEIQENLIKNGPQSVQAKYHGDRAYPARLDTYYMDFRPLFNNAYTTFNLAAGFNNMPPFRWWNGPVRYYYGDSEMITIKGHNWINFFITAVLPFAVITLFLISMLFFGLNYREKKKLCVE